MCYVIIITSSMCLMYLKTSRNVTDIRPIKTLNSLNEWIVYGHGGDSVIHSKPPGATPTL